MKILVLDIETVPNTVLAWGLFNQNISLKQIIEPGRMICWAAKWVGEKKVHFASEHHHGTDEMLERLWLMLDEADVVLHYNGTRFDIPTINKEFVKHGFLPPSPFKHIDLLRVARSQFRFASNKMDFVCQELGLGAKTQHDGMDLWVDCMNGQSAAWKTMRRYNKQDVALTERLYLRLLPWIKTHPNWGLWIDGDRPTCSNCGSRRVVKKGIEVTRTRTYHRYRCKDCGTPLKGTRCIKPTKKNLLT